MIKNLSPIKKLILFFGALLIEIILIAVFLILIFGLSFNHLINEQIPDNAKSVYFICIYSFVLITLYIFSEKIYLKVFNNPKKIKSLIYGFIIGFSSIGLYYYVLSILNYFNISFSGFEYILLLKIVALSFFVAFIEELVFREFIFNIIKEKYKLNTAIIITSYIYAQLHFLRFNLEFINTLIPLLSLFFIGLIFSKTYLSKGIFFTIGIHWSWIVFISYINQTQIFIPASDTLMSGGLYPPTGLLACLILFFTAIIIFLDFKNIDKNTDKVINE